MEEAENVGLWAERGSELHAEEAFIEQMGRRRALLGLSQGDLAARASALGENLYQQTIAKLESRKRSLKLSEADAIAKALGSTVQEMLSTVYGDPPWAAVHVSRDMEELEAAVAETLTALQAAQAHEADSAAQYEMATEVARQAGAAMREAGHTALVAKEKVRSLRDQYEHYAAELTKWREVEERTGRPHRPRKRGTGFVTVEEQKENGAGKDSAEQA
jgi:transcriptional regulator with XRE-family HTH domain